MINTYLIEPGNAVKYDDGYDQLQADILSVQGETATIIITKGNRRYRRKSVVEVSLQHLFPIDSIELLPEYHY